jgi:hypothetical protein
MSEETKIETPKEKPLFHNKSAAGKGDSPRNVSKQFRDNWDEIDWKKDGRPIKFIVKLDKNTTAEL